MLTPKVDQEIAIDGVSYRFTEHPVAPGVIFGQEGRYGTVYQLRASTPAWKTAGELGEVTALKVFKVRYRAPSLVTLAERIGSYAEMPGLQVCRRMVLTPQRHGSLLRQHPDLTYAVLMPWVDGPTWMQVMQEKRALRPEESLALAQSLAGILQAMEQRGVAHCDLSGPNIIIPGLAHTRGSLAGNLIALVDVEQLYTSGLAAPDFLPSSSPGYAHQTAGGRLWHASARSLRGRSCAGRDARLVRRRGAGGGLRRELLRSGGDAAALDPLRAVSEAVVRALGAARRRVLRAGMAQPDPGRLPNLWGMAPGLADAGCRPWDNHGQVV